MKVLSAAFSADAERRERFEREAVALAAIDHPNIVTVYSVEECDGTHFITMQVVGGQPLLAFIPPGGMELERFFELAVPLVSAVSAAHRAGVTHRDLKPSNVMVSDDGTLKVLDFGLAKMAQQAVGVEDVTRLATSAGSDPGRLGRTRCGRTAAAPI